MPEPGSGDEIPAYEPPEPENSATFRMQPRYGEFYSFRAPLAPGDYEEVSGGVFIASVNQQGGITAQNVSNVRAGPHLDVECIYDGTDEAGKELSHIEVRAGGYMKILTDAQVAALIGYLTTYLEGKK